MTDRSFGGRPMRTDTVWVNLGFLPVEVGYAPNARAWKKTLKAKKLDTEPYPTTAGRCIHWVGTGIGPDVVLITVGRHAKGRSMTQVIGIIAHECMHAWRHIRESIGEKEPSSEFEAYVLQAMVQCIVRAHMERRKRPWKPNA